MKQYLFSGIAFVAVVLASCSTPQQIAPEKEVARESLNTTPIPPAAVSPPAEPRRERPSPLQCTEDTQLNFNKSGIDAIPFVRVAFFDVDGVGLKDMIVGSKDGSLHLYKHSEDPRVDHWQVREGYFKGISAGAFSSPAMADIDGNGKAEVVVGTGGFSSDSGKILFFKNVGSRNSPVWRKIEGIDLKIGNDASVCLVDYHFDGKPDIIAGNSAGKLFFFRNVSKKGKIRFVQEKLLQRSFGMYAVPAAVKINDRVFVMVGNAEGHLSLFELKKNGTGISIKETKIKLFAGRFASPFFADLLEKDRFDLVLADSDGSFSYFENRNHDFTILERNQEIFNNRIFAGPACAPTVCPLGDRTVLVVGNMDGTLKLYEYQDAGEGLPWVEKKDYLKGIKVSGFSRGIMTRWGEREILIVGQSNGDLRAFMNSGSDAMPRWYEEKRFFKDIRIKEHTTPAVFDLARDGRWELITGAADGKIYAYRVKEIKDNLPAWEKIRGAFDNVVVEGFSAPSLTRDGNVVYLFVGQQDGRIRTYVSELGAEGGERSADYSKLTFTETDYLKDVRMHNHSSPSIRVKGDAVEMVSGDYDGNIRHFTCIRDDAPKNRVGSN
ncbi:MAG: FG-GAP repeat protein [Thermodesulfovibrionales bacterium]